ncbi:hypothetical protein DPMN_150214 [Dreissena polymorpha]|uniref:Uncharacterized protein n=1 Tax=Dreissena polymorpha TaxID=45954 RepID=A0A9D4FDB6_DREPO|nr:hypothetical protein DPMN_150214 [Dreissena polymorpha]
MVSSYRKMLRSVAIYQIFKTFAMERRLSSKKRLSCCRKPLSRTKLCVSSILSPEPSDLPFCKPSRCRSDHAAEVFLLQQVLSRQQHDLDLCPCFECGVFLILVQTGVMFECSLWRFAIECDRFIFKSESPSACRHLIDPGRFVGAFRSKHKDRRHVIFVVRFGVAVLKSDVLLLVMTSSITLFVLCLLFV